MFLSALALSSIEEAVAVGMFVASMFLAGLRVHAHQAPGGRGLCREPATAGGPSSRAETADHHERDEPTAQRDGMMKIEWK